MPPALPLAAHRKRLPRPRIDRGGFGTKNNRIFSLAFHPGTVGFPVVSVFFLPVESCFRLSVHALNGLTAPSVVGWPGRG